MTEQELDRQRKIVADAIRTFCQSLGTHVVARSSDGAERIYYAGLPLDALSIAVALTLCDTTSWHGAGREAQLIARDIFADDRRIIEHIAGGGAWRKEFLRDHLSKRDSKITEFFDGATPAALERTAGREADIARCLSTIENAYAFECETGALKNCGEWKYLKRLLAPSPDDQPETEQLDKAQFGRVLHDRPEAK